MKFPLELICIDNFCLIQSLLQQLQNNDFSTLALVFLTHLPVGPHHSTVRSYLIIYLIITFIGSWIPIIFNCLQFIIELNYFEGEIVPDLTSGSSFKLAIVSLCILVISTPSPYPLFLSTSLLPSITNQTNYLRSTSNIIFSRATSKTDSAPKDNFIFQCIDV